MTVDLHARELGNTRIFVSIVIRVDETTFSWERERSLSWGHLLALYDGDLEPSEELLWVLLHNRPFHNLEPRVGRITYPEHKDRIVFTDESCLD